MGFFGTYQFDGTGYEPGDRAGAPSMEPMLWVDIHDSDIAMLRYAPSGRGTGVAYLGCTPRIYFEAEEASEPTDPNLEANGLTDWWALRNIDATEAERDAKRLEILAFLASDELPEINADGPMDDTDIFVELKTARLLTTLGLPLPDDLPPVGP